MDPLTSTAAIISAAGVISAAILVTIALVKNVSEKKIKVSNSILSLLGAGTAIGMSVLLIANFSPGLAASAGITTGEAEAAIGPEVITIVQANKEGYVIAAVEDDYLVPKTAVSGATVYVSLDQPVANESWPALTSDNTSSTGSILLTVPGVTSGTVYVTAGKTAYYPTITTTAITGAQEIAPSLVADLQLPKIGSLSWTLTENTNAYMQGTENIYENATTSASTFILRIKTDNAFMALQDLRVLFVRGGAWTTMGAVMAPVVTRVPAGVTTTTTGDITLTTGVTGEIQFTGDVTFGSYIELTFVTSATTPTVGTMATIYIDDLSGTYDVLGGTGVSEQTISIVTVA